MEVSCGILGEGGHCIQAKETGSAKILRQSLTYMRTGMRPAWWRLGEPGREG